MKMMLLWSVLACFVSFAPAGKAQEAGMGVLYDCIRTKPPYDEPQLSPQQVRKILNAALGPGWRRRADQISISQIMTGSFTAANVQEVAYVIRGSGATDAQTRIDMGNDARLVVFSGSRATLGNHLKTGLLDSRRALATLRAPRRPRAEERCRNTSVYPQGS